MYETVNNIKLEVYKEIHFREVDRKNEVNERTKWLLSMWILILGSIIFCLQNYYKINQDKEYLFTVLIIYSITFALLSGRILASCFSAKPYAHLPSPKSIEEYLSENTNDTYENVLIEACSDAYDFNFKKNNELIIKLVDCTHVMIVTVILIFFSFLCFAPNWIEKEEPIQKIEIIKGVKIDEQP